MPKETNNKKQSKDKKHFMKDFKAELKRVSWPTPKQLANNTFAVITIVLITAVIVFALDFAFEKLNTSGIDRIKTLVETNSSTDENANTTDEGNQEGEESNSETASNETNAEASDNNTVNE